MTEVPGERPRGSGADASSPEPPHVVLIDTPVHGRVLVRTPAVGSRGVLVGFHGYAENAGAALERLESIPGADRWTLVAIQGLHRFYRGRSQETVASWMTREDREYAIQDNIGYVNRALERVVGPLASSASDVPPVVFAGFSQGVAMAFRAAVRGALAAAGIIAVGGDVPPELLADPETRFPATLLIRGARDDWYTQTKFDADVSALAARDTSLRSLVIDAGHEWTAEVSAAASEFLRRL